MALDKMRSVDLRIDKANDYLVTKLLSKQGDYNGRELIVQITNGGVVENQITTQMNLGWRHLKHGNSGLDPFKLIDADKGLFGISYSEEMLRTGDVLCTVQIIQGGKLTETRNFNLEVEESPINKKLMVTQDSFKALEKALTQVNEWDGKFESKYAGLEEEYALELTTLKQETTAQFQQTTAQLAQKADDEKTTDSLNKKRDKTVKIGLNDWSDDALGLVNGTGEFNLLTTPNDYSVSPIKTTMYNIGKNLVVLNELTPKMTLSLTGAEGSNALYDTTKMMVVPRDKEMTVTKGYRACFYNDSGAHVQTFELATTPTFISPTSYMKLSFLNADMNKVQIEINSIATPYERPYQYLSKRELERGNQVAGNFQLNDFDFLRGYISAANGGYTASAGYRTSKLIKLEKGDLFTADVKGSASVGVLTKWSITNNVETFIKNIFIGTNGNDTIKVSYEATENVEYIRVCTTDNGTTGFVTDTFLSAKIEKYHAQFKMVDDVSIAKEDISDLKIKSNDIKAANEIRKPVINFQFDDGNTTDANVHTVFKQYGLVCGFAIMSTNTRVDEYLSYQEDGFEILAHSTSGIGMNDPTMTDVEQRLKESKEVLESKGFKIKGWVTPYSVMNSSFIPLVKKYYEYATTVADNGSYNVFADSSRKLRRVSMESRTLEELKAIVDGVIANTGCLTFYAHQYPDTNEPILTEATLTGLLAYVKQKEDSGELLTGKPIDMMNHYYSVRHEDLFGLLA